MTTKKSKREMFTVYSTRRQRKRTLLGTWRTTTVRVTTQGLRTRWAPGNWKLFSFSFFIYYTNYLQGIGDLWITTKRRTWRTMTTMLHAGAICIFYFIFFSFYITDIYLLVQGNLRDNEKQTNEEGGWRRWQWAVDDDDGCTGARGHGWDKVDDKGRGGDEWTTKNMPVVGQGYHGMEFQC